MSQPEQLPPDDRRTDDAKGTTEHDAKREGEPPRFNLEVAGENAQEAVQKLKKSVQYWVDRGRYNKVRIKRAGKPVLPDIPIGALVAFEAATFFWTGLLRAALVNVVGRVFFEVELINEADDHYKKGVEHFLAGEMREAEELLTRALKIDERHAKAHLQMGVLRKVQGKTDDAKLHFARVLELAPSTDPAREAEVHLKKL